MSRTTLETKMKTNNIDAVLHIVEMELQSVGLTQKKVDNEVIWAKGDSVITPMSCVNVMFTGYSVILEGWIKDAVLGESELEGFVAMFPKKKLKKILIKIQEEIITRNL